MVPYIQSLLSWINDHLPPSNLATQLQPFILLDKASGKYVSIDLNLNLIILQKLDFLLSKEKQPNMLHKATTLLDSLKKRSRSKWIIGLFFPIHILILFIFWFWYIKYVRKHKYHIIINYYVVKLLFMQCVYLLYSTYMLLFIYYAQHFFVWEQQLIQQL